MHINGHTSSKTFGLKRCDVACKQMCVLDIFLSLESGFCALILKPVNHNSARVNYPVQEYERGDSGDSESGAHKVDG